MSLRRKIILSLLGVLLLLPTAAVYLIASTEAGLRLVASRLDKVGPVTITVSGVEGSLTGGFTVESVRVQHRRSDVTAKGLSGRLQLLPLLVLQRITLAESHIRDARVQVLIPEDDREPRMPRFLPRMMRLDADELRVDNLMLVLASGRELQATGASAALTMLPAQIRIRSASLDYERTHLVASGRVLAAQPVRFEGQADADWRPEGRPAWQFHARFEGDQDSMPLEGEITAPFHADVQGTATTLNRGWQFAGSSDVQDLDISVFGGGSALGIISADLDLTASADELTARGRATPPGLKAGAFDVDFRGAYRERRLTIHAASARHPGSGAHATVRGTVDVVPDGPVLDLAGQWTQFRWPLAATEPAVISPRGSYQLQGTKPWSVRSEGEVLAAGQPLMPVSGAGLLDGESFLIQEGHAQLLGGEATFTGEARWKPAEQWQVRGRMQGFDPTLLREDLPGRLAFDFDASGEPFGATGSIDFAMDDLSGTLRSQPASGSGRMLRAADDPDWQFRDVDLRIGRTHVQLDGGLGATRDISFAIDADDLSLFDADARGRISARGRYAGTAEAPLLIFKARGSGFEWQGYRLDELDADLDLNLREGGTARGQILLTGLGIGARMISRASFMLSGDEDQQHVALDVDAAPLRAAMSGKGAIAEGVWHGELDSLLITDAADLTLRLESPAELAVGLSMLQLAETCVKGEQERFCGNARLDASGDWLARFTTETLPLRMLTAGLTQNIHHEGTINLQAQLQGSPGQLPTGTMRSVLRQAQIRHVLSNGREERMELGTGEVTASATQTGFMVNVGLDAGEAGGITGALEGQREGSGWRDHPIRGQLDARTNALALLDIYVGDIDKATGRISTRVDIAGTLGEPSIQGELTLREASIDIYQVNLALRDLSMDARFDATALDLSGSSRLGEGTANFSGRLAWRDAEPYGNLKVQGERLLVVNIPEARIEASPDLDFKLDGRRIEASGEVRIPSARLEPADLTNAVLVSGDEELVGEPAADPASRWTVVSDIRLILGEDVHLENTMGLTARLGGTLEVRTDELQNRRGRGELNVASGKFAAMGRLLDVERGRLIFNNGPLGDPGVDLRAQKVFPDITAGVNVRGTLRNPRMTFYSEPAVPQSQIRSLILAGGSLESVQDSDRSGAARNDLFAQGGAVLLQRFGPQVGVDDVGIESDLDNQSSLVLGKYLSDRLYISYGISLAEAINTLKLRYTIGDRWTIKTEAGKERSADIVYTFKKD